MKKSRETLITEEAQNPDTDFETIENRQKILDAIQRVKASYLGEISWEAGLTEYQAKQLLNKMWKDGLIEQIPVDYYNPDKRLLGRVEDQSAKNQAGYMNFSKKKWYGLTPEGWART